MLPLIAFAQGRKNRNLEVAKNLDIFNEVYQNLDLLYVDTLNANEVVGTGIKAMLRSLDPYTEYYPESETGSLKMMLFPEHVDELHTQETDLWYFGDKKDYVGWGISGNYYLNGGNVWADQDYNWYIPKADYHD